MSIKKLFDLTGRVALITGGSRGLGLQMAEALGELGAKIAITARKADELEEARVHLAAFGVEAMPVVCDLSRTDALAPLVDAVMARFGQIDILVNNAGTTWGAPAEDHPLDAWNKVMNLNVTALFLLSQQVAKRSMIPRKYGRIVNIASIAGLTGNDRLMLQSLAYNTSKGAVVNFTRTLAAEWAEYGITVNAIAPGFFPSKMTRGTLQSKGDPIAQANPMRRLGGEEDLKGVAALLSSDASAYITGQIIAVDGGHTAI